MSRNIRWRLQFKSLNGTGCLVNIYDEDYSSNADTTKTGADVPFAAETGVTLLTGAAKPFEYEEDDDESLLNVLRYKTGYLRVIEQEYGSLVDLYPATNTSHYVEFYYGSRLDFTGYMQAQSFEDDWVAAPRQLDFPITSPLGLADGKTLAVVNPPTTANLASWLSEVITGLDAAYNKVIMPDVTHGLEGTISSLMVCPHSSEFSQSKDTTTPVFAPISYAEFVEGICNAFGWIVHDTPTALVFSMFDWSGNYCQYTLANLATLASKTTATPAGSLSYNLGNYVTVAGNDGKVANILPMKDIKVRYEGDYVDSVSFDFSRLKCTLVHHAMTGDNHIASFECLDGTLTGQHLLTSNFFDTNGNLYYTGSVACKCGSSDSQNFYILTNVEPTWVSAKIFNITFYDRPKAANLVLSMTKKYGVRVGNLMDDDGTFAHFGLSVGIKVGSLYYHGEDNWTSSSYYWTSDKVTIEYCPDGPIVLEFRAENLHQDPTPNAKLIAVTDIKLQEDSAMYAEYLVDHQLETTIAGAAGSMNSGEVVKLFSYERIYSNMIGTTVYSSPTSYDYLKTTQTRLQVPFRATLPTNPYQPFYSYWLNGWRWRLIAMAFSPREDETVLTLHRSSTLDSITAQYSIFIHGEVSSDAPAYVTQGNYIQFSLIPDDGYQLDYAVVMMGQDDITADCYDDGVVSIEEVTDDVTVYAFTSVAPPPNYFYIEPLAEGTFSLSLPSTLTTSHLSYIEYSTDRETWVKTNNINDQAVTITTPTLASGEKVYWRGSGTTMSTGNTLAVSSHFSSSDGGGNAIDFNIGGCIFSMLTGAALDTTGVVAYTFPHLFNGTNVIDASKMYFASGTSLGRQCRQMFTGCTKMTHAPLLQYEKVGAYSFYQMFYGCTSLSYIKCLATDLTSTSCLSNWVSGVAATGTFVKKAGVTWPSGASGIPSGWTVQEE